MKFNTTLFAILSVFFLVSFASAVSVSTPVAFSIGDTTTTATFTNTNSTALEDVTYLLSSVTISDGTSQAVISPASGPINNLNSTLPQNVVFTLTPTVGALDDFKLGTYAVTITATGELSNSTAQLKFVRGFCSNGQAGNNISVSGIDISSDGADDETWKPLDTITIDVDFENTGDDDLKDIYVEMGLYDSTGKKKTGELTFSSSGDEKNDYGSLDSGDDDTVTFEFQIPADMKEDTYTLAIKAYSDKTGEDVDCDDDISQTVDVEKEDDEGKFIAFDNILLSPTEATCGDTVTLSFRAYNVGDEDQDKVNVSVFSKDLKFSNAEETSNLDMGDSITPSYSFVVPSGLADKTYSIEIDAEYDYNKGVYRGGLDESYKIALKVFGCSTSNTLVSITASMLSEKALVGEQLKIKSTISNLQTTDKTFVVDAANYESWADLDSVSEKIFTLAPGASKEVTLTFTVDENADSGEQTFDVEVTSGTAVESREVAVNLEKDSFLSSILPASIRSNSMFWIIGLINLVLIILIIVVAIKLARH
ncbi:MAG: putative S-layer protein [archaeon]|nr:putative S-layer protein [archaeon]